MNSARIVELPAFEVAGWKTFISGQDNSLFGRFWERCRGEGLFGRFEALGGLGPGPQTGGVTLGVSLVEKDPAERSFEYMIAVEVPEGSHPEGLDTVRIPACRWAVFEGRGRMPEALVEAEMYAFGQWLPASGLRHALAPEMEVYPPSPELADGEVICQFWLPVTG